MANIYTGNGLKIFYNEDTANRLPQNAGNEQISEIAAMPTLHIAAAMAQVETYDSEYVEQLAGEQNVDPVEITVNYIPGDYTHTFLDEATETQKEFQLILIRRHSEGTLDYSLMNGRISAAALNGDKDSVVQKTYTFTPTEMIVRDATALASVELYEGSYGVGSNGVDVPQYEPLTPTGNSFIKVPADQIGNPVSVDMMGVGLIDGNTFSSIAMTKSGSLAIYAKNQTTAWTRILTSNLGDSKYVALTGDQSIDGTKTFIKGIYVDSLTSSNGISGKSLTVSESINGESITVDNSTLGTAQADNLTLGQPLSVANGGTGSKNATDARSALGVKAAGTFDIVPIANGGTNASTALQARINLGIKATAGFDILPIVNGGTGATTALGARNNIDVYAKSEVYTKTESEGKYLDKFKNLSDIANVSTTKSNLQIDRIQQIEKSTLLTSQDVNQRLILRDDKVWGYFDATGNKWNALGVTQGGTGANDPASARANLELSGFNTASTSSTMRSPNGTFIISIDNNGDWGATQRSVSGWKALGIAQGGTGAQNVTQARINLGLGTYASGGTQTIVQSPNSGQYLFINDTGGWGCYSNTPGAGAIALSVANGGTGSTDGRVSFKLIETDGTYSQDSLRLKANTSAYICYANPNNVIKWRHGYTITSGLFNFYAYDDAGTYISNPLSISPTQGITCGNINAVETTFSRTSVHRNRFPQLNLWASERTDVGAYLRIEIATQVGGAPYFYQMYRDNDATGGILNTLPRTAGVLAVQGTSGREYKKDIVQADSNEAISRILGLELVNFVYKDDKLERNRFGIIAEDAEKVAPQYIKHNNIPVSGSQVYDDEGNKIHEDYEDRPSVDVNPIVMDLIGCIHNQQSQIDELKALVETLLNK